MTGNLLPGHKGFVSPDPPRASQAAEGGREGGRVVCFQWLTKVFTADKMWVAGSVTIAGLHFHPFSTYLSCFLKGDITQCLPVFISIANDQCLCSYLFLLCECV